MVAPAVTASIDTPRLRRACGRALAAAWLALPLLLAQAQPAGAFGFDDVGERARALAAGPFVAAPRILPDDLKDLNYDQYRDIRFSPQRAWWHADGLPFELMFFHLGGSFHNEAVSINEIVDGQSRHLPFDRQAFDYGKNTFNPERWGDLGYAGVLRE